MASKWLLNVFCTNTRVRDNARLRRGRNSRIRLQSLDALEK